MTNYQQPCIKAGDGHACGQSLKTVKHTNCARSFSKFAKHTTYFQKMLDDYTWMVAFGAICCFAQAFLIGEFQAYCNSLNAWCAEP